MGEATSERPAEAEGVALGMLGTVFPSSPRVHGEVHLICSFQRVCFHEAF